MFDVVEIKEVKKTIGSLVKVLRKQRNLSQQELATAISVSRASIQNVEAGKNFTMDTLLKIFKELDVLDQFYKEVLRTKNQITTAQSLY